MRQSPYPQVACPKAEAQTVRHETLSQVISWGAPREFSQLQEPQSLTNGGVPAGDWLKNSNKKDEAGQTFNTVASFREDFREL